MPYAHLDDVTEVSPPPYAVRASQRDLKVARYGTRQGTRIGVAVGAVLCTIAGSVFAVLRVPTDGGLNPCMHAHAGFVDVRASCTEPVTLAEGGDEVVVYPGASLERVRGGVRVRRGKASFAVQKRLAGSTLRVHVSHGVIEVTGTRFTVEQGETGGRVELTEGTIVFHDDDGDDVALSAGAVLVWPVEHHDIEPQPEAASQPALAAVPRPTPKPAPSRAATSARSVKPAKPPVAVAEEEDEELEEDDEAPGTILTMEEILKRIAVLRQQKRLRAAVELLVSQSQRGDITPAQMARLSWEIGLFIQETSDKATACTHWRNHARKYPDDSAQIERVRRLIEDCDAAL